METIFCFCICEHGGVFKFVFLILSLSEIATPIPGIEPGCISKNNRLPRHWTITVEPKSREGKVPPKHRFK